MTLSNCLHKRRRIITWSEWLLKFCFWLLNLVIVMLDIENMNSNVCVKHSHYIKAWRLCLSGNWFSSWNSSITRRPFIQLSAFKWLLRNFKLQCNRLMLVTGYPLLQALFDKLLDLIAGNFSFLPDVHISFCSFTGNI